MNLKFWKKKKELPEEEEPNTLVLDCVKGRQYEYIQGAKGDLFRTTNQPDAHKYPQVRLMTRKGEELLPVTLPTKIETTPYKLFRARHAPYIREVFIAPPGKAERAGTFALGLLAAGQLLVLVIAMGR